MPILHVNQGPIGYSTLCHVRVGLGTNGYKVLGHCGIAYRRGVTLQAGLTGTATLVVAETDTALFVGSGDVPVLATPRVVLLAEQAAVSACEGHLPEGRTTVGYRVQLDHLAPTAIGGSVTAEATLRTIEGRRLTFVVSVKDHRGLVAAGRLTRVIVERDRFLTF